MLSLDLLAEQRIQDALARGEFDNLPGAGAPLELGDDALVPEGLRAAYRLLKNAGYLPPELEAQGEIRRIEQLLQRADDGDERARLLERMRFLIGRSGKAARHFRVEQDYLEKITAHLARARARHMP